MSDEERIKLITRNLEEVLTEEELKKLIESGTPLRHYIGFEISGKLHIGHLFQLLKVKDLHDAGAETIIWLADLHSAINDKLDGNLNTLKRIGEEYFIPAMKVLFECVGGDPDKLIFKFCSEEYAQKPNFWMTLLEVGKNTSLSRSKRSMTIMGRSESDDGIETAKVMYPIMQAADIFLLQVNIAQAGIDQRKVHVVARDVANQIETNPLKDAQGNQIKPIAIHTPILLGLNNAKVINTQPIISEWDPNSSSSPQKSTPYITEEIDEIAMRSKMSKSKADGAVSIHDSPEEITRKINGAYAPEGLLVENPLINWTKNLVFYGDITLTINRADKFGGDVTYTAYGDLEKEYADKKLHPMDLKAALTEWLIAKLEPARKYFQDPKRRAALEEIERLTAKKN